MQAFMMILKIWMPDPDMYIIKACMGTCFAGAVASSHAFYLDELRQQKAWELATAPAKQVPMQAFMMYMSGSGHGACDCLLEQEPHAHDTKDLDAGSGHVHHKGLHELATAPAKQVPMQAFMMYMSGSGIQIFSIMSVWL
jgi:hypothetical protein